MSDYSQVFFIIHDINMILGLLMPIRHWKSKYFRIFFLFMIGDMTTNTLRMLAPYNNFFYMVMLGLLIPALFISKRKSVLYYPLSVLWLGLCLGLPLYKQIFSFHIMILAGTIVAIFILFDLLKEITFDFQFSVFKFLFFLYVLTPQLRLYFVLAGSKLSEQYYITAYGFEVILGVGLILLVESNTKFIIPLNRLRKKSIQNQSLDEGQS